MEFPGLAVPITLQSIIPILLPLLLTPRNVAGGILLFLLMGGLGLPFFAGGASGFEVFTSNSGGYLIGFYIIALVAGKLRHRMTAPRWLSSFTLFAALHLLLMIIGLSWIWIMDTSEIQFSTHIGPYLPGAVIKSVMGTLIYEIFKRFEELVRVK